MSRRDLDPKCLSIGQTNKTSGEDAQLVSIGSFGGANWRVMAKGAVGDDQHHPAGKGSKA